jgi:hypothetical protein
VPGVLFILTCYTERRKSEKEEKKVDTLAVIAVIRSQFQRSSHEQCFLSIRPCHTERRKSEREVKQMDTSVVLADDQNLER